MQKQVPACFAAAPGVKVNLKPSPSQLSKQQQRLAQTDEYSLAQKSNPRAPAATQKPGSSWDHHARGPNLEGHLEWGAREPPSSVSSRPHSPVSGCTLKPSPKPPTTILSSKELKPLSPAWAATRMLPGHYRERVKGSLLPEQAGHPCSL